MASFPGELGLDLVQGDGGRSHPLVSEKESGLPVVRL